MAVSNSRDFNIDVVEAIDDNWYFNATVEIV